MMVRGQNPFAGSGVAGLVWAQGFADWVRGKGARACLYAVRDIALRSELVKGALQFRRSENIGSSRSTKKT